MEARGNITRHVRGRKTGPWETDTLEGQKSVYLFLGFAKEAQMIAVGSRVLQSGQVIPFSRCQCQTPAMCLLLDDNPSFLDAMISSQLPRGLALDHLVV